LAEITSKVPLRLSLAGGGSDVEPFVSNHGGTVLALTIELYVLAKLETLATTKVELNSIDSKFSQNIHPWSPDSELLENILAACLKMIPSEQRQGFRITVNSPVPPRSGLGASSAIILSVLSLIYTHLAIPFSKDSLAHDAYKVEREFLFIPGGCQDQYVCAHGGLRRYYFQSPYLCKIHDVENSNLFIHQFEESALLVWTGISRNSNLVLDDQISKNQTGQNVSSLLAQKKLVDLVQSHASELDLENVAAGLSESWRIKRSSSEFVSSPLIDEVYQLGMDLGAYGGKLLGAGGGGFFLFLIPPGLIGSTEEGFRSQGIETMRVRVDTEGVAIKEEQ
jgi:D-glycero-alpha-D-manno-heptose-7-phosphate kinase